ncbi:hypothetical protein [Chitinimonas prasina]|uniref:hypothetical protein n=1 Tax=Chitinimonas prasina TaxID=1434937 RepID=UPI0024E0A584|nr:hypothetical protein [Chitinimonas prasina]
MLNAIGKLEESQRMALQQMEPKLRDVYKTDGSWVDINEQLRSIWNGYAEHVRRQGLEPDPSKFATQFVDENFPG